MSNYRLSEPFEENGNSYCHGIVNCKYYDGECIFMDMGSGNPDDMPCHRIFNEDLEAFREWKKSREETENEDSN